jgi:hypothetical protein
MSFEAAVISRGEADCKFIVGLGTITKKLYERDKWAMY